MRTYLCKKILWKVLKLAQTEIFTRNCSRCAIEGNLHSYTMAYMHTNALYSAHVMKLAKHAATRVGGGGGDEMHYTWFTSPAKCSF